MGLTPTAAGRILVLDPDAVHARVLSALFAEMGAEVVTTGSVSELLGLAFGPGAYAILLEADCGDGDGFEVCAKLRARGYHGPVIFISGRHLVADKIRAFQAGADDYVVKPYDARELLARVSAVCRRFRDFQHLVMGRDLRVGDAMLSVGNGTFQIDGRAPVYLSPTEARLMECLMRDSSVTISRDTLLDRAWPHAFVGDPSRVDVVVARIRKKIEPDPSEPAYLLTVRGFGYTFRPALRPHLAEPALSEAVELPASLLGA